MPQLLEPEKEFLMELVKTSRQENTRRFAYIVAINGHLAIVPKLGKDFANSVDIIKSLDRKGYISKGNDFLVVNAMAFNYVDGTKFS